MDMLTLAIIAAAWPHHPCRYDFGIGFVPRRGHCCANCALHGAGRMSVFWQVRNVQPASSLKLLSRLPHRNRRAAGNGKMETCPVCLEDFKCMPQQEWAKYTGHSAA